MLEENFESTSNGNSLSAKSSKNKRLWSITTKELERIRVYRYRPGTYTYIDNLLTPYWNWAVTLLPPWAAPNLVTFVGSMAVVLSTAVILFESPDLKTPLNSSHIVIFAVCLFFYQTMDAIDGKQARRTNSSSPLGQLFDHGCDALVLLLCMMVTAATLELGATGKTMLLFCNVEAVFFLAQWEEYHTGTLNWSNGFFGVTESQLVQILVFLITAIFGVEIWHLPISTFVPIHISEEVNPLNLLFSIFTCITGSMFLTSLKRVYSMKPGSLPVEELGDKLVGLGPGFLQLVPFLAQIGVGYMLTRGRGGVVFEKHTALQILGIGISMTHIISRMIVHHIAKNKVLLHDLATPGLIAFTVATMNSFWEKSPLRQEIALYFAVFVAVFAYMKYIVGLVRDICTFLEIRCFHIVPNQKKKG